MNHLMLQNSLSGKMEVFDKDPALPVLMYNCGPTVYDVQHIGNLSSFVFADTLRKVLEFDGYTVKQVINITDIGHLSGDNAGDPNTGDDKMMRGLKANNLPVSLDGLKILSEKYTTIFLSDIKALGIPVSQIIFPRATEYIQEQISMVKELEAGGHVYKAVDGIYFDVATFPRYGELGGVNKRKEDSIIARVEEKNDKRNKADFALWKFNDAYGWESPWGKGFPGWHIECSAMATALLGKTIDIHTGGIEHVTIHHNNEIAQSECANHTSPFSRFWVHRNHIQIDNAKISKSSGSVVYLKDVLERGYEASDLRYFFLQAHYRTSSNFTWEALHGASVARKKLAQFVSSISEEGVPSPRYRELFISALHDDLTTPKALSVMWMLLDDSLVSDQDKKATILEMNKVLGLDLSLSFEVLPLEKLPLKVTEYISERRRARTLKDWNTSDDLRKKLMELGYEVIDTATESVYEKEKKKTIVSL